MSETYRCGDHEALVAYVYDECEASEHQAIATHVAACPACAEELESLGETRRMLSAWTPPEARLGFQITQREPGEERARVLRPMVASWWRQPLPAWAQMAAAVAIFASGVALGVARTATTPTAIPATVAAAVPATQVKPVSSVTPQDLAAVEQQLRGEMAQIRQTSAQPAAAKDDAALLRRVQVMINDSEQRQRQSFALQTAQIVRSLDAQRRIDMVQMQRNIGQIQEVAGAAVRGQSQMVNYLMNVSQQR
jgi:anti-sigma factor RsiW